MSHVQILSTGGTISMRLDQAAGGAVPTLTAQDFLGQLPAGLPEVQVESYSNLPTSHMTLDFLYDLSQHVAKIVTEKDVLGVVVTTGTDLMEEIAYLLDLVVDTDKPIVLTGAMRHASQVGYEGMANLAAAVRVAAHPDARALGAPVVMNDQIHAARYVTKTHTQSLDAFQSPGWGPLGRLEGDRVIISQRVKRFHLPCSGLTAWVPLIKAVAGADDLFLRFALEKGADGVVIEALGGGRVPPWWMPHIKAHISQGKPVVIASRCISGRCWDEYGYEGAYRDLKRAGAIFSEGLSGPKARLKLIAALGQTKDLDALRGIFEVA